MKNVTWAIVAVMVLLLGSALPAQAWGGYGRHHGYGFHHGFGGYYRYPYRSYAFSAPDVRRQQPTEPTVYVQQQFYWYYCEGANAYYPHVQQCPRGWSKVVPSPSSPSQ